MIEFFSRPAGMTGSRQISVIRDGFRRDLVLMDKLHSDCVGSFLTHFYFKSDFVVFLDRFDKPVDVYENTFLGFHILYETISFRVVKKGNDSFSDKIGL